MAKKYQEMWNKRIRESRNPSKFGAQTMETMAREGGPFWKYQQDPHNTDAYREGWDRIFGKGVKYERQTL